MLAVERGDFQAMRAKQHRIDRHPQGVGPGGQGEMHLRIGARQELARSIVDLQLDLQRAGGGIQRARGGGDGGGVALGGTIREYQRRR